jgi:hypothetical protein
MSNTLNLAQVGVLALLSLSSAAWSDELPPRSDERPQWAFDLRAMRFSDSHTSYEFGNPEPPLQVPLSRLEFPMGGWWFGGELRRSFGRYALAAEYLQARRGNTHAPFKDSDWTGDFFPPDVLDVYSEAQNRVERSSMARIEAEVQVGDVLGLPDRMTLSPVVGVRWQDLNFVAHDGLQVYPASGRTIPADPYPGNAIAFRQRYTQYFVGLKSSYALPFATLSGQLDWAYVDAANKDHHLLRGARYTYEATQGDAVHFSLGLQRELARNVIAGIRADHMRIRTTGTHRWVDSGADETWSHGVRVWSAQTSVSVDLEFLL